MSGSPIARRSSVPPPANRARRNWCSGAGAGRAPAASRSTTSAPMAASSARAVPDPRRRFLRVHRPQRPQEKRKHKWLFTLKGEPWFCIAGLWRKDPAVGEAFTMLTGTSGPDIAPYHSRQVVVLRA